MKEEWKVFIRGVEGRGNEIIKILTDLEAENNSEWTDKYMSSYYIYFINHKGHISSASINSETAKIIIDNYREIKLPEWKDGDILINNDGTCYKIFSECDPHNANLFYAYNVSISVIDGKITHYPDVAWSCYRKKYSIATPSQVERFYELLHASNKDWDAEKKQLVDLKWKPKKGERYWFIGGHGQIRSYVWNNDFADIDFFNFGNYFKTKEEAEAMAKKIKKLLNAES